MMPSVDWETRTVEIVHPAGAPIQVSATKTSVLELAQAARLPASPSKATNRPLELIEGTDRRNKGLIGPLSLANGTRVVEATHPDGAPAQVSRTKRSVWKFVSPATRLFAFERNATKRPS